jgi:hypothetical protein
MSHDIRDQDGQSKHHAPAEHRTDYYLHIDPTTGAELHSAKHPPGVKFALAVEIVERGSDYVIERTSSVMHYMCGEASHSGETYFEVKFEPAGGGWKTIETFRGGLGDDQNNLIHIFERHRAIRPE